VIDGELRGPNRARRAGAQDAVDALFDHEVEEAFQA